MPTCEEIEKKGLLQAVAENFQDSVAAGALLAKSDLNATELPPFGTPSIIAWWRNACGEWQRRHGEAALIRWLQSAADTFPGDPRFAEYLQEGSKPNNRANRGGNVQISGPETMSVVDVIAILNAATSAALATGADVVINLGSRGSSHFSLSITGEHSEEQIEAIRSAIERSVSEIRAEVTVSIDRYQFRDYYSDPLTVEGPDSQQFAIDQIRASTTVSDLARGLINQYSEQGIWPSRKEQGAHAVIDKISPDGASQRLDPRMTLHDAGVRPGDTLRVSPERTAGAIDPVMRETALARVRNEVLAYAESHPGFEVEANSLVAPTEYLFRFSAPGFGSPTAEDEPPKRVNDHEVLIELPADFPIKAPQAWWQTDIYHPNIDPKIGWVCLGALQEHYRPSMDFGELCQMLVDLASYKNYAVTEGHNAQAARWALSPEGQIAIESIGGISVVGRMLMDGAPDQKFHIRKL